MLRRLLAVQNVSVLNAASAASFSFLMIWSTAALLDTCVHLLCMQGYSSGFPVLLPNRLSQQRSSAVLQTLLDGNYLDRSTRQLTAEVVTYNADLRVLGYTRATFDWQPDGAIKGKQFRTAGCNVNKMSVTMIVSDYLSSLTRLAVLFWTTNSR
jgi:hypothetical protein